LTRRSVAALFVSVQAVVGPELRRGVDSGETTPDQPAARLPRRARPSRLEVGVGPVDCSDVPTDPRSYLKDGSLQCCMAPIVLKVAPRLGAEPMSDDEEEAKEDDQGHRLPNDQDSQDGHGDDRSALWSIGDPTPSQQPDKRRRWGSSGRMIGEWSTDWRYRYKSAHSSKSDRSTWEDAKPVSAIAEDLGISESPCVTGRPGRCGGGPPGGCQPRREGRIGLATSPAPGRQGGGRDPPSAAL
jgi:hypothetical protein